MNHTERATELSPWRSVFDELRDHFSGTQEPAGAVGSINWLRSEMEKEGGNPRVIRNIIYRDKGRVPDKQALYRVFEGLWERADKGSFHIPELDYLIEPGNEVDQEVLALLGREKRRAFKMFVSAFRQNLSPKMLIVGPTGSGKTLTTDYIQLALEHLGSRTPEIVRFEFGSTDITTSLSVLAAALGVARAEFNALLTEVGMSTSFAVQADAQAAVAQAIVEAAKRLDRNVVLMMYISDRLDTQSHIGGAQLRLNTRDVQQATAVEWLWYAVLEPLSHVENVSLIVSLMRVPDLIRERLGAFREPIVFKSPSKLEARRYVRGRLPDLNDEEQELLVERAGRSYEELRSLTLFTEAKYPIDREQPDERYVHSLAKLLHADVDLSTRRFLRSLAVLSLPDWPSFELSNLLRLQGATPERQDRLGMSFIDPVPGREGRYRPFSRQFQIALRDEFKRESPTLFRDIHRYAGMLYREDAQLDPHGEPAGRMVLHWIYSGSWEQLKQWLSQYPIPHPVTRTMWKLLCAAKEQGEVAQEDFEELARSIVRHYLTLGAYTHPDATAALDLLSKSTNEHIRTWSVLRCAYVNVSLQNLASGKNYLAQLPDNLEGNLRLDAGLLRSHLYQWEMEIEKAAEVLETEVLQTLEQHPEIGREDHLRIRAYIANATIEKHRGNLHEAIRYLSPLRSENPIVAARISGQMGDAALQIGLLDLAENRLKAARERAFAGRALPEDRYMFPLRLARVYRHTGDMSQAAEKLDEARRISQEIQAAESVSHLYILEEAGLIELTLGRPNHAIETFSTLITDLKTYGDDFGVNTSYHRQQAIIQLAIAYACRGTGMTIKRPFPVLPESRISPDVIHSLEQLEQAEASLRELPPGGYGTFVVAQAYFAQILFSPDIQKKRSYLALLQALPLQPRQAIEAELLAAGTELAAGNSMEALIQLESVATKLTALRQSGVRFAKMYDFTEESGHPGLTAQLAAYRIIAHVQNNQPMAAAAKLTEALRTPALLNHQESILRVFGTAIESYNCADTWKQHRELRVLLGIDGTGPSAPARLPDALIAGWKAQQTSPEA